MLAVGIAAASITMLPGEHGMAQQMTVATPSLPVEGSFPSLHGATHWLNSAPLKAEDLRGKVVIVDFWTYSCINWRRTLPYLRAWSEKYKDKGLVIIGVHSPEFPFEKDVANVRQAARAMGITYPIAIDSDHTVWRAFRNEYWPAIYFIDARGNVRHHVFGEGNYEQSERVIQQLLAEAGSGKGDNRAAVVDARGVEAPPDWANLKSWENYFGFDRTVNFADSGRIIAGRRHTYVASTRLGLNQWTLSGDWEVRRQSIRLYEAGGRVGYRFHARDLHLVMGPIVEGASVRFRVRIDGQPPRTSHGTDVNEKGEGIVTQQRLYQLVRQSETIDDRQFEIDFLDPGVEAFSITFG